MPKVLKIPCSNLTALELPPYLAKEKFYLASALPSPHSIHAHEVLFLLTCISFGVLEVNRLMTIADA